MTLTEIVQLAVQGGFAAVLLLVLYWQRDDRLAERTARLAERGILEAMRDSLIRIEAAEAGEREENRFLRESFAEMLRGVSNIAQRVRTMDAVGELHQQETSEVHTMVQDVHRVMVERPTGIRRRDEIERSARERERIREEVRPSSPPFGVPKVR